MELEPRHASDHHTLTALLLHQRALLERLRYRHIQLRVLLEAGESRFLGRAIDELADAEEELTDVEEARASVAAGLAEIAGLPERADLRTLSSTAPTHLAGLLTSLGEDLEALLAEVEAERRAARTIAHARVGMLASGAGDGRHAPGAGSV